MPIDPVMEKKTKLTKILILSSNPRSGSSYLADILTPLEKDPFYVFEPLRWLYQQVPENETPNDLVWRNLLPSKPQSKRSSRNPIGVRLISMTKSTKARVESETVLVPGEDKIALLDGIFQCSLSSLETWLRSDFARHYTFRKPLRGLGILKMPHSLKSLNLLHKTTQMCESSQIRLVKCIRLRLCELTSAISNDENRHLEGLAGTKIILLVRDPRAVLTSISFAPDHWEQKFRNASRVCLNILQDLDAWSEMHFKNDIFLLKYEDLASSPKQVSSNLAQFLETPELINLIHSEIKKHVLDPHTSRIFRYRYSNIGKSPWLSPQELARSKNKAIIGGTWRYYGTIRENDFDFDGWKNKISRVLLQEINLTPTCQQVFKRLNYSLTLF